MSDTRVLVRYRPDHADEPIKFFQNDGTDLTQITVTQQNSTITFVKKDDSPDFTFAGFQGTDEDGNNLPPGDTTFTAAFNQASAPTPNMVVTDTDATTENYGFKVGIYPSGNTSSITWSTLSYSRKRSKDPIPEIVNQGENR